MAGCARQTVDEVRASLRRRDPGHRPGQLPSPGSSATSASSSTSGTCRWSTAPPSQSTRPGVFFGGDAASGPKNIIWAVEHGHQAAISIHKHCQGEALDDRLPFGMNLSSRKMGIHEWSYSNDFDRPAPRRCPMPHVSPRALPEAQHRGGAGLHRASRRPHRGAALPELRRADGVHRTLCIECDACVDVCPVDCLTIDRGRARRTSCAAASRRRLTIPDRRCTSSGPLKHTGRVMVKDENVCVHCGLCAERCPTAAWDMQKCKFSFPYAADEDEAWQSRKRRTA